MLAAKQELLAEKQISEKSQKELESDLVSAKHRYLEVQHQLSMAEKVDRFIQYLILLHNTHGF